LTLRAAFVFFPIIFNGDARMGIQLKFSFCLKLMATIRVCAPRGHTV